MTPALSSRAESAPVPRVAPVRLLAGVLLGLAVLALAAVAVFVLPAHLAPRSAFTSAGDAVRAQNDARAVMVQFAVGLVLLIGAFATWRQLQLSRDGLRQSLAATNAQLKAAQDQLMIAQESQLTQRFAQAVEQLGSEQIVVRLGGIYALERVARNSPADAGAVAELLCSYVRQHAPRLADPGDQVPDHLELRAADVRTVLFVLKKGAIRPEGDEALRLLGTDLRLAGLDNARLPGVDLEGADLRWAWLRWASLDGADLSHADLRGAHLEGASLVGADLDRVRLEGAVADDATVWPAGFSPRDAGVVFVAAGS